MAALAIVLGACASGDDDTTTLTAESGGDPVTTVITVAPTLNLVAGTCFDDGAPQAGVPVPAAEVVAVDCAAPHQFEAFATVQHPAGRASPFPGVDGLYAWGSDACLAEFEGYVGVELSGSLFDITLIQPAEGDWDRGDRRVTCVLVRTDYEPMTGSQRGTG
jgi:hypothetical protein